jgi:hypothetical protein
LEHGIGHAFFAVTWVDLFSAKTGLITVSAAAVIHSPSAGSSLVPAGPRLTDTDLFAQELFPVKALNCRLGLRLRCHFHKAKTPGLAGIFVFDHSCRAYLSEGYKSFPNCFVRYIR